jgi:ABC-2 type transport system permease protein
VNVDVRALVHDGLIVTRRNLLRMKRVPDVVVFAAIQPLMFVLLFAYVFGSAIKVPGISYREFLMAGVFTQTVAFGSASTSVGLAEDLQRGIIERFRSLPMSRAAVLIGRTSADLLNNLVVTIVLTGTGLLVGWRLRSSVPEAFAGFVLLLLFAYAMSWISAFIGLSVRSVEVAQSAGFIWLFPVTFVSNAFVPTAGMPRMLRVIAEWNPISAVTTALRKLFGNTSAQLAPPTSWPERHAVGLAVLWCIVILVVFVPLSVRRYRIASTR